MTALANGTYVVSSLLGGDLLYLGFSNGAAGTALLGNNFSGDDSQEWVIASSTVSGFYTFKNQKYQTYVTFNPPAGAEDALISGQDATNGQWYITQSNTGYIVGIDPSLSLVWNVYQASTSANAPMILYDLQSNSPMNEFWKFTPVGTSPSSTSSSSSSTSTSVPSASCTCSANQGMDLSDKIAMAVGLGVGVPTLLVAIMTLFKDNPLTELVKNRAYGRSGNEEYGLMSKS